MYLGTYPSQEAAAAAYDEAAVKYRGSKVMHGQAVTCCWHSVVQSLAHHMKSSANICVSELKDAH